MGNPSSGAGRSIAGGRPRPRGGRSTPAFSKARVNASRADQMAAVCASLAVGAFSASAAAA